MSGRYLLLKTKQHIPATSAIIATTVSSTLQRLRQNRFSFHQTRKEMNLEAARSCLWADWCPNRWRMDGESWRTWFVMSTHPDRAQTWLFRTQQAPDFTLPTCFQNKRVVVNTHTHTVKEVEKHLNCHRSSTSSAFTLLPLERMKTCSALVVLFISKLAWLCIEETNWPGHENSQSFLHKSLLSPLMEDWSIGLEKAKSKPSIAALCSHIFVHISAGAHQRARTKTLTGSYSVHTRNICNEQTHCISGFSQRHGHSQTLQQALIGTEIWLESIDGV